MVWLPTMKKLRCWPQGGVCFKGRFWESLVVDLLGNWDLFLVIFCSPNFEVKVWDSWNKTWQGSLVHKIFSLFWFQMIGLEGQEIVVYSPAFWGFGLAMNSHKMCWTRRDVMLCSWKVVKTCETFGSKPWMERGETVGHLCVFFFAGESNNFGTFTCS